MIFASPKEVPAPIPTQLSKQINQLTPVSDPEQQQHDWGKAKLPTEDDLPIACALDTTEHQTINGNQKRAECDDRHRKSLWKS